MVKAIPEAYNPRKSREGAAGYDLYTFQEINLLPKQWTRVDSGIEVCIPYGYCGLICAQSNIKVLKEEKFVLYDHIDAGRKTRLNIYVYNRSDHDMVISSGESIARLIVVKTLPQDSPKLRLDW